MTEWKVFEYTEKAVIELPDGEEIIFPYEDEKEKWLAIAKEIVAAINFCRALKN